MMSQQPVVNALHGALLVGKLVNIVQLQPALVAALVQPVHWHKAVVHQLQVMEVPLANERRSQLKNLP